MKTLVIVCLAFYFLFAGIFSLLWRCIKYAIVAGPIPLTIWLIYQVSINHWPGSVFWGLAIFSCVSLAIWYRMIDYEYSFDEMDKRITRIERVFIAKNTTTAVRDIVRSMERYDT